MVIKTQKKRKCTEIEFTKANMIYKKHINVQVIVYTIASPKNISRYAIKSTFVYSRISSQEIGH